MMMTPEEPPQQQHTSLALCFPSTETSAAHTSFLKRKSDDMTFYNAAASSALAFFATTTRVARKADAADHKALKRFALAKFNAQRKAIGLDQKKADEAYAAAAADSARRSHVIATAALKVTSDALHAAQRLVDAAASAATENVSFTLCIGNISELEARHRGCTLATVAAYKSVAAALCDLRRASEAARAAEAADAELQAEACRLASMLQRHRNVSKEYAADALKLQRQMEALIEERQCGDVADYNLVVALIADGKRQRMQ
jgi:hypothetical protein